jgi:hypothetical protein
MNNATNDPVISCDDNEEDEDEDDLILVGDLGDAGIEPNFQTCCDHTYQCG